MTVPSPDHHWSMDTADITGAFITDNGVTGSLTTRLEIVGTAAAGVSTTPISGLAEYGTTPGSASNYFRSSSTTITTGDTSFTVSMWVRPTTATSSELLFSYSGRTYSNGSSLNSGAYVYRGATGAVAGHIVLRNNENNTSDAGYTLTGFTAGVLAAVGSTPVDTWTHVAFSVNTTTGSVGKLYINGVKVDSVTTVQAMDYPKGGQAYAGWYPYDGGKWPFTGGIDDIQLWHSALTDAQVLEVYQAVVPPPTEYCVAVQGSQTAEGTATKTGTLAASGTIVAVQSSQTAVGSGANVKPDNWGWAVQGGQFASGGAQITAETIKHYFATSGVTLNRASEPAGQEIPPTLQNPGNFKRDINIGDFGIVKPSFGEIVISNLNGDHDDLLTKGFDGQRATLYYGPKKGTFPGAYRKVLEATVGGVSYDQDTIRFKIKDNLEYLDRPYLQKVFTGAGGSEGDASVVGQKRQKHFGYLPYLPPQLIDAQKLIYLISDQSIYYRDEDDLSVYDGGVLITHGGLYTSAFELENSPPAPGTVKLYANYQGPTYMRLGSSPVYDVRVSTNTVEAAATTKNDLSPQDMVAHVIGSENVSYTAERFIYGRLVRDDETIADVITDHCRLRCVNAWADRNNVFRCQPFNVTPNAYASTYEFNQHIITSVMFEQIIPARKVVINSGEVFSGTVAGGASDVFKRDMKKTGSLLTHEVDKSDQYAKHRLAPEAVYTSRCYATEDQLNIEDDLWRWGVVHDEHTIATVTIKNGFNTDLIDIDLNDIVTLKLPRFGLSAGQKCTVVGVRHDYRQNSLTFRLWW